MSAGKPADSNKAKISPFDRPEGELTRFKMVRSTLHLPKEDPLPFGYRVENWVNAMLPAYAAVLAVAFADSPELNHYPRLASREGCLQMMNELVALPTFLTGASWLILHKKEPAAIVVSRHSPENSSGIIEMLAVSPKHRGVYIGRHILFKALWAFRDHHFRHAEFRINKENRSVIRFFRNAGFHVDSSETFTGL